MKKNLTSFAAILVILTSLFGTPILVSAENGAGSGSKSDASNTSNTSVSDSTKTSGSTSSTDKTTSTSKTTTNQATDDSSGRATRIQEDKNKLKTALSDTEKVRIGARCEGAQAVVKGKGAINKTATETRTKVYGDIVSNLQSVSKALAAKGANVDELNTEISSLQTKIDTFNAANTAYQNDLSDLSALDCKTDPTAFQAALQVARTDQATVLADAKAIRSYLTDTVKPTLEALKQSIQSSSTSSSSSANQTKQ